MLKDFGYAGTYRNDDISVDAILENPLNYGLKADLLAFLVTIKHKHDNVHALRLEDFKFYLMDESDQLHNVRSVEDISLDAIVTAANESDSPHILKTLITIDLKHELLYQDIRIAFCYQSQDCIKIINLNH